MLKFNRAFFLLLFFITGTGIHAQTNGMLGNRFFSNWSVSISGGPNIFFGYLKENPFLPATSPFNELRYVGTFSLNRQFSHVFMLRAQVLYGEIAGGKTTASDGTPVNRFFEGNILEYNLNTTINLSNLIGKYNPKRFFFVYFTIGAGATSWNTKVRDITTQQPLYGTDTVKNWTYALVVPVGLGCYFSIKDKLNLGLEYSFRGVNLNQIDHSGQTYPYEAYSMLAFSMTYNFNKRTSSKLNPASYQKQIGPPPPKPQLQSEIEAAKAKEAAEKAQSSYPKLNPPAVSKDTIPPKAAVPPPDTLPKKPVLVPDTLTPEQPGEEMAGTADTLTGTSYRVQFFAYKDNTWSAEQVREKFSLAIPVNREYSGGWYRYTVGSFASADAARQLMNEIRTNKELHDAFVVKYVNGKRAGTAGSSHKSKTGGKSGGSLYYPRPKHKK